MKSTSSKTPKSRPSFTISGNLWIDCKGKKIFGPGPAELLEGIERTGSINQAAKDMSMSYKKAWEIINRLNDNSLRPLVITQSGGEKGEVRLLRKKLRDYFCITSSFANGFRLF